MTVQLSCEKSIYSFSKNHAPIVRVTAPARVEIETYDCFTNQVTSTETFTSLDWDRINPATGPIEVEDAEPGDILKVHIETIEWAEQGIMATGPKMGVMGHRLQKLSAKPIAIRDGKAIFNEQLHIPLNPMIGVMGVAPAEGEVPCGTPGSHGGNMDNKLITEGATLYFPVFVKGALFGLGDLHAAMGDGEVCVSGIEIPGKVTVQLDVIKGFSIPNPPSGKCRFLRYYRFCLHPGRSSQNSGGRDDRLSLSLYRSSTRGADDADERHRPNGDLSDGRPLGHCPLCRSQVGVEILPGPYL